MKLTSLLHFMVSGGAVQRFHTIPTLQDHSVGRHSFEVAWLCYILSDGKPSVGLLIEALAHDLAESETGDVPAPVKRMLPAGVFDALEAKYEQQFGFTHLELSDEEHKILKWADYLSGMLECVRERTAGNKYVVPIYNRFKSYIPYEDRRKHPVLNDLMMKIHSLWENA